MNQLKTFVNKFADKTETKIGFKNTYNQIRELYTVMMSLPTNGTANEKADDAMFSKKPLGGFSCASCDKKIENLQKCQSQDHMNWKQMPFRDKSEHFSKIGTNLSKILNSARNEQIPQTTYQKRIGRLNEISESMTEMNKTRVDNRNEDLTLTSNQQP